MSREKVIVKGGLRPAISVIGGQTYVVNGSGWKPVPQGTTLADVEWIPPVVKPVERPKEEYREVVSSKGNKTYQVMVRSDGAKSCTCSGFMYRRRCRHVDELKKELGW